MSFYNISRIYPSDKRSYHLIDRLLADEGIRRDINLDYTCGIFDDDMNIIATGSCFNNTLRCLAVSSAHQGDGLMNQIVMHLMEEQFSRGNTHIFLYTKSNLSFVHKSLCDITDNHYLYPDLWFNHIILLYKRFYFWILFILFIIIKNM